MQTRLIATCAAVLLAAAVFLSCSESEAPAAPRPAPAARAPAAPPAPAERPAAAAEGAPAGSTEAPAASAGAASAPLSAETIEAIRAGKTSWITALPSPAVTFQALDDAFGESQPGAWASCLPGDTLPPDEERAKTALLAGTRMACFFAAVRAQDAARTRTLLDRLLVFAERLGIAETARAHSPGLIRDIDAGDWADLHQGFGRLYKTLRLELMTGADDEETAMLVTVGAWLKAIDVTSRWLVGHHTSERASMLRQGFLPRFFRERLGALQGEMASSAAVRTVATELDALAAAMTVPGDQPFDLAHTRQVSEATTRALASIE